MFEPYSDARRASVTSRRALHETAARPEQRIEQMHILIVEDEQRLARLVARVLGEERHVVDVANDGDTGLDLALRGTYDLLILDLMLPGRSGLDICKQVRAHKLQPAVLMLTARGSIEDRVAGLRIGADDYLVKPFPMEELVAPGDALPRRRRAITR